MTMQAADPVRPWTIHRNRRGWPRWYQRWLEAWWIASGKWTLHRAWQEGLTAGSRNEWQRIMGNGGDLGIVMREVVDHAWGRAMEDGSVPSSKIADEVVAKAWRSFKTKYPIPISAQTSATTSASGTAP